MTLLRYAFSFDIERLLEIESECFQSDLIEERVFKRFLKNNGKSNHMMVSTKGGTTNVTGYILILTAKNKRKTIIHSFGVSSNARGTGAGALLIAEGCLVSRNLGYQIIETHVRVDNPHAIDRYVRSGFEQSGQENDYYEDGCSAVIYQKVLT